MELETRAVIHTSLEDESGIIIDPSSNSNLKNTEESENLDTKSTHSDSDDEYDEEDEDDFTFACAAADVDESSFTADDIFDGGKIRPVFPLFDQSLVDLPPVKNFFMAEGVPLPSTQTVTESSGEAKGSHYNSSRNVVVEADHSASPESCKKSNSTGFSKIWRFKEMTTRSHSDGRDAFVFLKKPAPKKKTKDVAPVAVDHKSAATVTTKKKSGGKGKETVTAISVHEAYVKSKAAAAREEERRRPYLQYKPVGFFTNIHGTMTKNVHPF